VLLTELRFVDFLTLSQVFLSYFFAIAAAAAGAAVSLECSLNQAGILSPFFLTFHTPALSLTSPNKLLSAEMELNTKCVVDMEDNQTVLHPPASGAKGENR